MSDDKLTKARDERMRPRAYLDDEGTAEELKRDLEMLKFALDQHVSMTVADTDGTILYVNDRFCELSGYARDELVGENHRMLKSGVHTPEVFADLWDTIMAGEVWHNTVCNKKKGGGVTWSESTIVPFLDKEGNPFQFIAMRTNITRLKETEEALRASNTKLHELNRRLGEAQSQLLQSEKLASLGQLAAGVAHEINNPMGYIDSNLGMLEGYLKDLFRVLEAYQGAEAGMDADTLKTLTELKSGVDLGFLREDVSDLCRESREGVTRVTQIVQDLKNFSRVDDAKWQWTDLHHGLDSTLNVAHNEIKYKAELVKEFGSLPEIQCRPARLNQVFLNLLINAAQAIDERGTITVRTGAEPEWVWVEVEDTGKGIPIDEIGKIFDPFFTTKEIGQGTGLGLSLSHGIVSDHGGRIEVDSKPGEGTRFRVWLPVMQQEIQSVG